jgi:hypothetical protein
MTGIGFLTQAPHCDAAFCSDDQNKDEDFLILLEERRMQKNRSHEYELGERGWEMAGTLSIVRSSDADAPSYLFFKRPKP